LHDADEFTRDLREDVLSLQFDRGLVLRDAS
jgi:hypothetical protein